MTEIHTKLRLVRESFGYSQQNVADMLGKSQQYISDIESGHAKISFEMLEEIANKVYKKPVTYIIEFGTKNEQHNHNQQGGNAAIYIFQQAPSEILEMLTIIANILKRLDKNE